MISKGNLRYNPRLMKQIQLTVYADQRSLVEFSHPDSSFIIRELKRSFGPEINLRLVDADAMRDGSAFQPRPDILVLPGIKGEVSLYPDHIGPAGNANIRHYVEQGGTLMAFCASAYYASSQARYQMGDVTRQRLDGNLALFNGVATGPVPNLCRTPVSDPKTDAEEIFHLDPVLVEICDGDLKGKQIQLAYGLGPMFHDASAHKDVDVLARYASVDSNPAAIIDMRIAKGHAILFGALPQLGYEHNPVPHENILPKPVFNTLSVLFANEPQRKIFWHSIMQRIAGYIDRPVVV